MVATYKVIQDIEAEDKLLGPFTLRQFVYAVIVIVIGFINFKLAAVNIFFTLPLLPPMLFFALLAAPFGHDQSSEVWLLAKIRFMLKPRKRLWDQDGAQEMVTITAPKKIERQLTNDLSQTEIKSRLHALANTLDSRGWAVKNVDVNMFSQPSYFTDIQDESDRLVGIDSLPQDVPNYEIHATDDILDETSNPTAQHLDAMIHESEQSHRQALINNAHSTGTTSQNQTQPADYWFMNQSSAPTPPPAGYATFQRNPVVIPGAQDDPTSHSDVTDNGADEQQLLEKLHDEKAQQPATYRHLKTLQPLDDTTGTPTTPPADDQATANRDNVTGPAAVNPDILRLASNDDLNVATIAREANRSKRPPDDDEVVISLR
jgi:hypothetical protein